MAGQFEGHQNQGTIEKGVTQVSGVVIAVKQTINQNTHNHFNPHYSVHDSDWQECDEGVIGCLNMLTQMYRTGCLQHYSRISRTSSHEQIHYKRKKNRTTHIVTQDAM